VCSSDLPSTLLSILFLLLLFIGSFLVRKKYPLIALAILFFFAAHLMESTVIGLELYFEHRNYIAAIFLFLPLAAGLYALSEVIKPSVVIFLSLIILVFLSAMTWQRASLWSDENKLMLYWAQNSPNSPRAQSVIAVFLAKSGNYKDANAVIERALTRRPESGLLALQLLRQKIEEGSVTQQDFIRTKQRAVIQRADTQAAISIRDLILYSLEQPQIIEKFGDDLLDILNTMSENQSYLNIKDFHSYILFLQGRILTVQHKPDLAYKYYSKSLGLSADVEDGLNMVIVMGNAGYLQQALKLLNETEAVYDKQPVNTLKKSRIYYDETIKQTRHDMLIDLHAGLSKVVS
jgi:tetratricopeptide (TPR) repeat protein